MREESIVMPDKELSHLEADGRVRFVDVGDKAVTRREACARGAVRLPEACRACLAAGGDSHKGNVFAVARLAGIMAAKRTHELIPLCHPLPLTGIEVDCRLDGERCLISSRVSCEGRTGVEMEALTAVSVAALTVYDMLKALSHDLVIEAVELEHKSGGRSGTIER